MALRSAYRRPLYLILAALLLAVGIFASACSDDSGGGGNAEVINAINIMDKAGLHDIDESINNDKEIPANALTVARQVRAVIALTEWPDDLQSQADALEKIFEEFETVLAAEQPDMAKAAESSKKAHDAEHDFSHDVWAHLYEEAGISTEGGDGH